jgi:hypothetical protein
VKSDLGLPPLVAEIANGSVTWQRIEGLDYEVIGYFLSCHLIIEHYIDEYLKVCYPALDWDAARHTFNQKVCLMSRFKISDKYDCIPPIKHLNSLRNQLSHNLTFKMDAAELLPLVQYLTKVYDGEEERISPDTKGILSQFTSMVCVLFAGYISSHVTVAGSR